MPFRILIAVLFALPLVAAQWTPAGTLPSTAPAVAAFTLPDGRVLVLHDGGTTALGTAGGWSAGPSLTVPRIAFAAAQLPSGVVVVVGGAPGGDPSAALRRVEAFLPWTGAWYDAGDVLATGRADPFVAVLPSGRLLVAGGRRAPTDPAETPGQLVLTSAEILDPVTRTSAPAAAMAAPHWQGRAARLAGGDVLVVGGNAGSSGSWEGAAEVYREALDAWLPVAGDIGPRAGFALTALPDGGALVTGGTHVYAGLPLAALRYRSGPRAFAAAGQPRAQRAYHGAAALPDGRVLVFGGDVVDGDPVSSEVWVPWTQRFAPSAALIAPRALPVALPRRFRVLAIGGGGFAPVPTVEAWAADPAWLDALRSLAAPLPLIAAG